MISTYLANEMQNCLMGEHPMKVLTEPQITQK